MSPSPPELGVPLWDVRAAFPILAETAYFNTSTVGVMAAPVADELLALAARFEQRGWLVLDEFVEAAERARGCLARAIGAAPDEVALTSNATDGVNLIASGLSWEPGDEVVLSDQEHPAMNYPWTWLRERRGVRVRRFAVTPDAEECLARLTSLVNDRTRLIGTSWVTSYTGTRLPVGAICRFARSRGCLSLVDGAQAFGAIRVDVREIGCDFFTSNGHKWLGGPKGTGFLYARAEQMERLEPAFVGAGSVATCGPDRLVLHASGRRFEYGTRPLHLYAGLASAVAWLDRLGWERVAERTVALAGYLKHRLTEVPGVAVHTPLTDAHSSGLVTYSALGVDAKALLAHLRGEGRAWPRTITWREGEPEGIRVSTAYFNAVEEIDRLVDGTAVFVGKRQR